MARATFHIAGDGYAARDAATWTEEKLMILDCYLRAFAKACSRAGGWYGLDLFAGTGLNYSLTRDEEIPGSPLDRTRSAKSRGDARAPGGEGRTRA